MQEGVGTPVQRVLSGALAGGSSAFFTAPLDLLKTRLQIQSAVKSTTPVSPSPPFPTQFTPSNSSAYSNSHDMSRSPPSTSSQTKTRLSNSASSNSNRCSPTSIRPPLKYTGIYSGLHMIVREEGFRGLFKGLSPTLLGMVPTWAIYFTAYAGAKEMFAKHTGEKPTSVHHAISAVCAGCLTCAATNPLWVIKVRLQTQHITGISGKYHGIVNTFLQVARQEGVRGLYKGLSASILGVSHVAIQFPLYEKIKRTLDGPSVQFSSVNNILVASTLSKLVASGTTYPHEVVRTRMQYHVGRGHRYRSVFHALSKVARKEGFLALYRGAGANIVRVVPACAINFCVFESMMQFLVTHEVLNYGRPSLQ